MEYILMAFMSPILLYYGIDTISTFKEYKIKDIYNIIGVSSIDNICNKIDLNNIKNLELRDIINNFVNVVLTNFNSVDLYNFYNNINSYKCDTKINKKKSFFIMGVCASYNIEDNEIEFGPGDYKNCINHELFHMASSKNDGIYSYSGFHFINYNSRIKSTGVGINEGYTQLLAEKYFNESEFVSNVYQYMVIISKYLENIVGKEKMQSLYMRSDLFGLINELKKYRSEEEIMRFLTDTDFLINNYPLRDINYIITKERKIRSSIGRVDDFIVETYSDILGYNNYKKQELANDIYKETNSLLPRAYRRVLY